MDDEAEPFDFASTRDAELYDELPLWSSLAGQLLLENVTLSGARRALDLGCGTGFPLVEIAERLGRESFVAGVDPWGPALARARSKLVRWAPRAAIVRANGASIPFRSESFDLVTSNLGVNNFADASSAFLECHRVLRAGGILGLSSNLVGHMRELYDAFGRTLSARGDREALERLRLHVGHRATIDSLREALGAAGFRVTQVKEREALMRFADPEALFTHHFVRMGFRSAWEEIAGPEVLGAVAAELRRAAASDGTIVLTIPLAYVEAVRA